METTNEPDPIVAPNVPAGWKLLKTGAVIRSGDKWRYKRSTNDWQPCWVGPGAVRSVRDTEFVVRKVR